MGPVRCKKHGSRKRATFSDIWAGQYVTFAKEAESGDIYSWGLNNYYQLGKNVNWARCTSLAQTKPCLVIDIQGV